MATAKVSINGSTILDLTSITATAADVGEGKYFVDAAGVLTEGTALIGDVIADTELFDLVLSSFKAATVTLASGWSGTVAYWGSDGETYVMGKIQSSQAIAANTSFTPVTAVTPRPSASVASDMYSETSGEQDKCANITATSSGTITGTTTRSIASNQNLRFFYSW